MKSGQAVEYIVDNLSERVDEVESIQEKVRVYSEVAAYCALQIQQIMEFDPPTGSAG